MVGIRVRMRPNLEDVWIDGASASASGATAPIDGTVYVSRKKRT